MNNSISTFDKNTLEYDKWFDKHSNIYQSEILALKKAIPPNKKGVEIGSGTGRFSFPFKINIGVEPSPKMSKLAEQKGMTILNYCGLKSAGSGGNRLAPIIFLRTV